MFVPAILGPMMGNSSPPVDAVSLPNATRVWQGGVWGISGSDVNTVTEQVSGTDTLQRAIVGASPPQVSTAVRGRTGWANVVSPASFLVGSTIALGTMAKGTVFLCTQETNTGSPQILLEWGQSASQNAIRRNVDGSTDLLMSGAVVATAPNCADPDTMVVATFDLTLPSGFRKARIYGRSPVNDTQGTTNTSTAINATTGRVRAGMDLAAATVYPVVFSVINFSADFLEDARAPAVLDALYQTWMA